VPLDPGAAPWTRLGAEPAAHWVPERERSGPGQDLDRILANSRPSLRRCNAGCSASGSTSRRRSRLMERSTAPPAHICILRSGAGRASARDQSNLTLKGPVSLRNRFHEAGVVDYWLIREPSSTWCRGLGAWN